MDLYIKVVEIEGHCPVYKIGDTICLKDGYMIPQDHSVSICMHSLASIMPYYTALVHGVDPYDLGLAPEKGRPARVQCLDPCHYTGGGTVFFEISCIEP